MRILTVSNFYPPHYIGGYELGCRDAVEGLRSRGHDVRVLTSTYGVGRKAAVSGGTRLLEADLGWKKVGFLRRNIRLLHQEIRNRVAFKNVVRAFEPDLIYLWNLTHISISIALQAQQWGIPTSWYVFDNWLSGWDQDRWYSLWHGRSETCHNIPIQIFLSLLLKPTRLVPPKDGLNLDGAQFASRYLRSFALAKGRDVDMAEVIPWGLDTRRFPFFARRRKSPRLLYVGQIMPHKGVKTAVEALKRIGLGTEGEMMRLTIAGGTINPDYETGLRKLVSKLGLEKHVHFMGFVPHEELPRIYQEHDILIFPSLWDEPFGIALLEAMSSGLAVVATATGGSAEIIDDGENALVFPRGDAQACANQVQRLSNDFILFQRLVRAARRKVEEKFRFETTLDRIEDSLSKKAMGRTSL